MSIPIAQGTRFRIRNFPLVQAEDWEGEGEDTAAAKKWPEDQDLHLATGALSSGPSGTICSGPCSSHLSFP